MTPKTFPTPKSERTFDKVLAAAADLFQRNGFDNTTMRQIAQESQLALGALYYYFRSKEEMVLLFYERMNRQVLEAYRSRPEAPPDFASALSSFLRLKLEYLEPYRGLLRVVMKEAVDPESPLCPLSPSTAGTLALTLCFFSELVERYGEAEGEEAELVARGLWMAHMAILGYWLHDRTPGYEATYRAIDSLIAAVQWYSAMAFIPGLAEMRKQLLSHVSDLFRGAGLEPNFRARDEERTME